MKVVIAEKIAAPGIELLKAIPGAIVVGPEAFSADPKAAVTDADALIVRSAVQADASLLQHGNRLRVIGRAGVGVDNIDAELATQLGIVVMNAPGANAIAVAELTIGLMLSLARFIPYADTTTRAGKWEKKSLQGTELRGKTLGIIGLGRIGIEVANRAHAMDMTVIATDPFTSPARARDLNVKLCSLDELYAEADYISLHVGLTQQTTGMINAESIAKMKSGVRIVNCARGELIDETSVAEALNTGRIAGAALDVFPQEPPKGSPLLTAKNLIATPHLGGSTAEAQHQVGIQIATQVRDFLVSGVVQNATNVPSLTNAEYRVLQPFLNAAQRTGTLLSQLFDGNLEEVRIRCEGPIRQQKTELIRSAAIAGVMQDTSQENVNIVNAKATAEAKGISIHDETSEADGPGINAVQITLHGGESEVQARCTVVHGIKPRLIALNGIEVESPLEGHLLIVTNRDLPGVVGHVGSVLAKHNINIARFSLGRLNGSAPEALASGQEVPPTARAVAIVQTDTPVLPPVMEQLKNVVGILNVRTVVLPAAENKAARPAK